MEEQKDLLGILDMLPRPVFFVKENRIIRVNQAAKSLLITPETDIHSLFLTGTEEYAAFAGGQLNLTLSLIGRPCGATVIRSEDTDVFVLDQESDMGELRSLALAAQVLRAPLSSISSTADQLYCETSDPDRKALMTNLQRGLHQMHRLLCNMSDANRITPRSRQETRDITRLFAEIFEKAETLIDHVGIKLTYHGLSETVISLANEEQLERAVLNILSNAVKFTPKGGTIDATLTRNGRMLHLSIQDSGSGIPEDLRSSVFNRYLRKPDIGDSQYGIGLGMVLIRSAAANHGGTVLIDQPNGQGTRVTMTLAIRQNADNVLRSPSALRYDYAGGRDHGLLELSESLPADLYEK